MARKYGVSVALLGLLVACDSGSDTGNPLENGNVGESSNGCEAVSKTALPFATASALGFSAADVLAYAEGEHRETLRWQTLRFGSYGPETGEQPLALTVSRVGSTARLVHYEQKGGAEIFADCADQLEIDVDVTLVSGGGALDETLRSTLVARRAEVATLHANIDPTKLGGSLTVSAAELGDGWELAALNLDMQFTAAAISGSLAPSFEMHSADSVGQSPGAGPLALFGLAPCTYGVAVPADAEGMASSSATLALLDDHQSANLSGSSAQAVTVTFEPSGSVCQLFADPFSPYQGPAVAITGTLAVKTAGAGIDGSWPVLVRGTPDDSGALSGPVTVELDPNVNPGGSTLATRYGISQPSDAGYDSSALRVMLSLSPETGWSGTIVVEGFVNAVCPMPEPGSNSTPGCAGAARTELARWDVRD